MKHFEKKIVGIIGSMALAAAASSVHAENLRYAVGKVAFEESAVGITANMPDGSSLQVETLPGGKVWPLLQLDEYGRLYIAGTVIDTQSGKKILPALGKPGLKENQRIRYPYGLSVAAEGGNLAFFQHGARCSIQANALARTNDKSPLELLKDQNISFAVSDKAVLALATRFGEDGAVSGYSVKGIDIQHCKLAFDTDLGNPDLLVEFGWTKAGGWWLTGSVEQTLLRSTDGRHWARQELASGVYSLTSSYVASPNEIWLAAGLTGKTKDSDAMLVHSADAGKTWSNIGHGDQLLKRLPPFWLEGIKRGATTP
jgi:hypothetical protein